MTPQNILDQLDVFGFKKFSDTQKLQFIQDAYSDILRRERWPFLITSTTFNSTAGANPQASFPADVEQVVALVDTTTNLIIRPERLDTITKLYPDTLTTAGDPQYYYFIGNTLNLWPITSGARSLLIRYFQRPNTLIQAGAESTILLPPAAHELLVQGAIARCFRLDRRYDEALEWEQRMEKNLQDSRSELHQQQFDRTEVIDVVDPADWDYSNEGVAP